METRLDSLVRPAPTFAIGRPGSAGTVQPKPCCELSKPFEIRARDVVKSCGHRTPIAPGVGRSRDLVMLLAAMAAASFPHCEPCVWTRLSRFKSSNPEHYSARNAMTGPTRLALRAGTKLACMATPPRATTAVPKADPSYTVIS